MDPRSAHVAPTLPLPFLQQGVAQIAFVVRDLDRTVEAFWTVFGIGPWHFYTYGPPMLRRMTYHGRPVEYRMRLALSNAGPTRIELIELGSGPTVYADFVAQHGYGVQHLGVLVDDMAAAIEQAEASGIRILMDGAGFGVDGDGHYAYLDTEALLGTTIELIARPRQKPTPEKVYPPG
jgi:catechol 2,3-dioxygenase-like lactoylglutathione lyase family enzyme